MTNTWTDSLSLSTQTLTSFLARFNIKRRSLGYPSDKHLDFQSTEDDAKCPKHETVSLSIKRYYLRKEENEKADGFFFSSFVPSVHDCSAAAELHFTDSVVWNSDSQMCHKFDRLSLKIWPCSASSMFWSMVKKKELEKKSYKEEIASILECPFPLLFKFS